MPPDAEDQQHRNPPGARRPVEDGEPLEEGCDGIQEPGVGGIADQQRARQRRDRHRPHVDPVGRREVTGREPEEGVTVEDQRHHPDVKHPAPEPHGQGEEIEVEAQRLLHMRRQQGGEHGNRLGRDHRQQPGAGDPGFERGLFLFHCQGGEDRVGEQQPQADGKEPQDEGEGSRLKQQQRLAPEDAGGRDLGEKPRTAQMVDHVEEHRAGMGDEPQRREGPEDRVGQAGDGEQPQGKGAQSDLVGGQRDDAGRHDHAEAGRQQGMHLRRQQIPERCAGALPCGFGSHRPPPPS